MRHSKIVKTFSMLAIAASSVVMSASVTAADNYPNRPVKFIVPWPPGDLEDILTRVIAEEMSKETGMPATVVNKPGGGGVLGAAEVARSRTDGSVIGSFVVDLLTTSVMSGNAPYSRNDFEPVGIFLDYPFVLAVRADAPYSTLEELADYSQQNNVSLAHFGYQNLPTALTFKAAEQLNIKFSSDAAFDSNDCSTLANGDADVINTTTQQILPCINSKQVKLLTSFTHDRLRIAPELPTLFEKTGISQTPWNGLFVKSGTSEVIKERIAQISEKALQNPRVIELIENTGAVVYWTGRDDAEKVVELDYNNAEKLIEYMNK